MAYAENLQFWYIFWLANFVIAGSAFALIALVVAIRGITDLRTMLKQLREEQQP